MRAMLSPGRPDVDSLLDFTKCELISVDTADKQRGAQMTALRKVAPHKHGVISRVSKLGESLLASGKFVTRQEMDDRVEDAELNAIADERAGGPFTRVSLNDL